MPNIQGSGFVIDVPEECIDASVYTYAFPERAAMQRT